MEKACFITGQVIVNNLYIIYWKPLDKVEKIFRIYTIRPQET
jgi:hypothetical protein